jgi:CBS domain-containing protein
MFDRSSITAADVMTRDLVTVHPDDSLRQAARLMLKHGVAALPVVDAAGAVVGVVSEGDLLRPDEAAEKRTRWWLDVLAEGEELSPEFLASIHEVNRPVAKVMNTDLITVTELTPLREVAELIARQHVRRVLVLDNGKLVGVVARRDLVRALARGK